jgi:hypothetical protein
MKRAVKFSARFLAIVAVIALIQMTLAPSAPVQNPYGSALSNISVGQTFAFPINCPNDSCGGKKGCRSDHGFYCTNSNGSCQTSKCI